jgi:adenylate kinase
MIIVVTGTPGVGKSTVSKLLALRLGAVHIDLSELALREKLTLGWDEERKTAIADIEQLKKLLEERFSSSSEHPLVVEGHYASDVVPPNEASFIFVLRKDPWKLKKGLESRGYSMEKVMENIEAEVLDVCLAEAVAAYGENRVSEIDVTDKTTEAIVEKIVSIIKEDKSTGVGKVDWLSKPGVEQLLEGSFWEQEGREPISL